MVITRGALHRDDCNKGWEVTTLHRVKEGSPEKLKQCLPDKVYFNKEERKVWNSVFLFFCLNFTFGKHGVFFWFSFNIQDPPYHPQALPNLQQTKIVINWSLTIFFWFLAQNCNVAFLILNSSWGLVADPVLYVLGHLKTFV